MKQTLITALIAISITACNNSGDSGTMSANPDSTAMGTGVNNSPSTIDTAGRATGDSPIQRQGMSSGAADSMGGALPDSSRAVMTDTSNKGSKNAGKSLRSPRDTARGKKNHYPDSSKHKN